MSGSLPEMIDFYLKEKSDRFEILAFHEASVKTLADLDQKLPKVKEKHWKGRDLPFPILMDATGETLKEWGIRAFPTTVLIDPEGRLAERGDLEALQKALKGELNREKAQDPGR